MANRLKQVLIICLISLIPTALLWTPFVLRLKSFWSVPLPPKGMETVVSNYDGPLFLVVAKSMYDKEIIKGMTNFPLPTEYYAAHLPLFPILIKPFAYFLGYPYAMLLVTSLSSILATFFFSKFISQYLNKKDSLWTTFVFSIFPARWLIVRSVGSSEPLFVAGIIASIYFFQQKKYLTSGIWGAVAMLTKSPGILLFAGLLGYIVSKTIKRFTLNETNKSIKGANLLKFTPILLIPLSALCLFVFYYIRTGDFWAYFHSGDNIHLFFPPFQVFNYSAPWVGTFWLEEITFIYLIGAIGVYKLIEKREKVLAWFVGLVFVSTLFVAHRDIMRYFLPAIPFLYVAFSDLITKKEFKIAFLIISVPIFLYSIAFISQNAMPVSNWAPFL